MTLNHTRFYPFFLLLITSVLIGTIACNSGALPEPSPIPPPPNLDEITPIAAEADGEEAAIDQDPLPESEDPTAEADEDGATPIAEEEATVTPEPTPTLAPTAVPQTDPPIQSVNSTGLPPTSRDLVFIGDGALKLWTHQNLQLVDLYPSGTPAEGEARDSIFTQFTGDITHFDVSADGNRIAAARITRTETLTRTLEGSDSVLTQKYHEHEILFLDVVSKETWVLAQNVTDLQTVQVSPNQQTVAFIGSGLEPIANPEISEDPVQLNVYTVLTPDKGNLRQIGSCTAFCNTLLWHSNSELFFYTDGTAMWLYNLSASAPEKLLDNRLDAGLDTIVHTPSSLASNGRYLLITQSDQSGSRKAIYDIPTGQIIPIPDTFVSIQPEPFPPLVSWMPDTRLLVTKNDIQGQNWQTTLELYRVSVDEGIVNREEVTQPDVVAAGTGTIHLENGRFAYALINQNSAQISGLYIQTSFSEPTEKNTGMIPGFVAPTVVWSPAGDGAIFVQNGITFFGNGGGPINMSPLFGQFTHGFEWLPATNVDR
ncbi:MAG: hypothetical protein AAF490_19505 [Chloroflexota bacterium]